MKTVQKNRKCSVIKEWLCAAVSRRIGQQADWIQQHIASCPRCQRRLLWASRVNVALQMVKSQPHSLDLLMRANSKAVSVLKHALRASARVQKLEQALPEPTVFERLRKYRSSAANVAACIAILVLMKTGLFSSTEKFQKDGKNALRHYYASRVGDEIADELFST